MNNSKRLKIAFILESDPNDKIALSGTPYSISKNLNVFCGDIHYIRILPAKKSPLFYWDRFKNLFLRLFGKKYEWGRSVKCAKYLARQIQQQLESEKYDLIYADKASVQIAFLDTSIPIIYGSDTVFAAMINYYPGFTDLTKEAVKIGNLLEQKALDKSKIFICPSEWAAESAINYYGIDKKKIHVIPRPCSFEKLPSQEKLLKEKRTDVCHLLFVGVEWKRKGADIAVDTVNRLNELGIKASLTICGIKKTPPELKNNPFVKVTGFLNRNNKNDAQILEDLFLNAHFFILPARAECFGNVFVQACAYGLPILTANTGGIPSVVTNNENGILLELQASGFEYASVIKNLWIDKEKYNYLRKRSVEIYSQKFSNEVWGKATNEAINKCLFTNQTELHRKSINS
ncbi:MAG: glycosyl transferase group 1 [uncultured bacterium]|nr:MAG: glycosyl transferase group 1 [uncultured bacterium]